MSADNYTHPLFISGFLSSINGDELCIDTNRLGYEGLVRAAFTIASQRGSVLVYVREEGWWDVEIGVLSEITLTSQIGVTTIDGIPHITGFTGRVTPHPQHTGQTFGTELYGIFSVINGNPLSITVYYKK